MNPHASIQASAPYPFLHRIRIMFLQSYAKSIKLISVNIWLIIILRRVPRCIHFGHRSGTFWERFSKLSWAVCFVNLCKVASVIK